MVLKSLSIANLRSYELYSVDFNPSITLILGANGSGKTSLLEAVYFLYRGTSFRGSDRDMIAHSTRRMDVKTETTSSVIRRATLAITADDKLLKQFIVDSKKTSRLPTKYRLPVVLFEPDELRMLSSSPQRRRQFIDDTLSRLDSQYSTLLGRYGRTLLQRNELLKQRVTMSPDSWDSHLFAWDIKFAELAGHIVARRHDFIATSNANLSRIYSRLASKPHEIRAKYTSSIGSDNYSQRLLHVLQTHRTSDAERGFTSAGPHRDDIEISIDGHPAADTASRGEMRTIMLAYKLLEVELQHKQSNQLPLILMDDVFSELDITRERKLIESLQNYQTIITATDLRDELKTDVSIVELN